MQETQDGAGAPAPCPRCEQPMRAATVRTSIWREERLVVVDDIPAQVCDHCMDQFYDDDTTEALRRLVAEDFASLQPAREIVVPVYSLEGRIERRPPVPEEESYIEY